MEQSKVVRMQIYVLKWTRFCHLWPIEKYSTCFRGVKEELEPKRQPSFQTKGMFNRITAIAVPRETLQSSRNLGVRGEERSFHAQNILSKYLYRNI